MTEPDPKQAEEVMRERRGRRDARREPIHATWRLPAGEAAELLNDVAADGVEVLLRQREVVALVHVRDRGPAVDEHVPLRGRRELRLRDVVLVLDVADDLLDHVLERHQALEIAILVDH